MKHARGCRTTSGAVRTVYLYLLYTRVPGESYRRPLRCLLCSSDVFPEQINSLDSEACKAKSKHKKVQTNAYLF